MTGPRIGSLFSGYGGLEQGVQAVLGGSPVWHSEIDPGACRVLAHRYPDVPNLGDITAVDWSQVDSVDVLTGGFPCQDVSAAGKRAGIAPGTRSGLWSEMHRAIVALQPSLVVIENVRGLLSAAAQHPAHGDLEPCPWCVGDDEPVTLRALGAVLGDLADSGFHARWAGLRAADVGAPHGRFRVFVVAWPAADAISGRRDGRALDEVRHPFERATPPRSGEGADRQTGNAAANTEGLRSQAERLAGRNGAQRSGSGRNRGPAADAQGDGRHEGWPEPARLVGGPDAALGGDAAADADSDGREVVERVEPRLGARGDADRRGQVDWGQYAAAVRHWERVLGRVAPSPAEPGRNGQPRLSPAFVEWLMGLPAGWVTDVPGVNRNAQLKALGNGVVPQQATAALRLLLADSQERAA